MKWLSQFSLLMRSNVTAICEQVENPERMLHQLVIDMEDELESAKRSVAEAIADEIMMRKTVERESADCLRWEQRAQAALSRNDESAARAALEQRMTTEDRVARYRADHERQQIEVQKLQDSIKDLQDKIRQAKQKKTLLLARMARASTANKINATIERVDRNSALSQFRRLESRVEREEAVCEAWDRLEGGDPEVEQLDRQFVEAERQERLDVEMERLKSRLGQS